MLSFLYKENVSVGPLAAGSSAVSLSHLCTLLCGDGCPSSFHGGFLRVLLVLCFEMVLKAVENLEWVRLWLRSHFRVIFLIF